MLTSTHTAVCRKAGVSARGRSRPACASLLQRHTIPQRICKPSFRQQLPLLRAGEENAEQSTSDTASDEAPASSLTPLQRAQQALEADSIDKPALIASLSELEVELVSLNERLAEADARVAGAESSLASSKDQFLRLSADFDNFRRRTVQEKAAISSNVKSDVVKDLLPLVDNFELARTQVKAETEAEQKINNSYQGLYKQMVDIMRSLGVEAVSTVGQLFDPELHEAIMREPSDEVADGTVLLEFRKGFKLGDKLIRPAMVKVSFSDAPSESTAESNEEDAVVEEQQEAVAQN